MAFQISLDSNIKEIQRSLSVVMPQVVQFATASGLNKGMTKAASVAIKTAAKSLNVAQKYIRGRTKRTKAYRSHLYTALDFNPRGLNPLRLGMSPSKALTYYTGRRVGEPFVMRMPNGSEQIVVRLPESQNPSTETTTSGKRRKGRLPVASIRIFIGRETITLLRKTIDKEGTEAFEKEFFRLLERGWARERR